MSCRWGRATTTPRTAGGTRSRVAGYRVDVDDRAETLGKRIRDAEVEKVPYAVVWGDRESEAALAVRRRGGDGQATLSLDELLAELAAQIPRRCLRDGGRKPTRSFAGPRFACYALPSASRDGIAPHLAGGASRGVQPSRKTRIRCRCVQRLFVVERKEQRGFERKQQSLVSGL